MKSTVIYIFFGVILSVFLGLFMRNRAKMRDLPIYGGLKPIPKKFYLIPVLVPAMVSLVGIFVTSMVYSSLTLAMLMAPFFFLHLSCEPMIVKKIAEDSMVGSQEFSRLIKYGQRSRKYLLGITLCLCMMYISQYYAVNRMIAPLMPM